MEKQQIISYTMQDVIKITGLTIHTIRDDVHAGILKSEKMKRKRLIYPIRLKEYLLENYPDRWKYIEPKVEFDITCNEEFKNALELVAAGMRQGA